MNPTATNSKAKAPKLDQAGVTPATRYWNHCSHRPLKLDKRGRIRFTVDGVRYDVSKHGIHAYRRDVIGETIPSRSTDLHLGDHELIKTLGNALELVERG